MPIIPPSSSASQVISSGLPRGTPLSDFITEIGRWMRESVDTNVPGLVADAINDAIEDLWMVVVRTVMSELLGGPVQLTLAPAAERVQVVSVTDPVVPPACHGNIASGALGLRTYSVTYSLATESGTETNLSPATIIAVPANMVLTVDPITATFATDPATAFGYNVYVAPQLTPGVFGTYFRQNIDPLDLGAGYQEPAAGCTFDSELNPVAPKFNSTGDNVYLIDHLEIQTPDGSYAGWSQADIDSTMMRRAARSLPEVSPYGRFLFDYISGGTLEIRPPAGATLAPRYFYVNRPRKLRYPNAPLPLGHIPGAMPYMRFKAISLLKLVNEEYQASSMWASKAQDEELKIAQSLNRKTMNRNNRVTPLFRP